MKKINAFTLIEVIVTMAISGIVIAACYDCFIIINDQLGTNNKINQEINEAMKLDNWINTDVFYAVTIKSGENSIYITTGEDQTITYEFDANFILRQKGVIIDTFKLKNNNIEMGYKGNAINDEDQVIDFISFDGIVLNEKEKFSYNKQYAADQLIPIELNQNNF